MTDEGVIDMVTRQLSPEQMRKLDLTMAARLVNTAERFHSSVSIRHDRGRVHLGSLIGLLTIPALKTKVCALEAEGSDEEQALTAILDTLGS